MVWNDFRRGYFLTSWLFFDVTKIRVLAYAPDVTSMQASNATAMIAFSRMIGQHDLRLRCGIH